MKKHFIAWFVLPVIPAISLLILFFCPITASAASNAPVQSPNTYSLELDAASMKITVPDGWDVVTRDTADGKEIFSRYGADWDAYQKNMQPQSRYLTAFDPATGGQMLLAMTNLGTGTPAYNFYKASDGEVQELANKFAKIGIPMAAMKIGGYAYICGMSGNPPSSLSCQTRIAGQYVTLNMSAAKNGVLDNRDIDAFRRMMQGISFREDILAQAAQGWGFIFSVILWFVLAVYALVRLITGKRRTVSVTQAQYERLGRIGGAPLIASIRAMLGLAAGIYFLVTIPLNLFFLVLCIIGEVLLAGTPVLMIRRSRAFVLVYALGIILTDLMIFGAMKQIWSLLLVFMADPVFMICLLASKRTAVLFKSKRVKISDAEAPDTGTPPSVPPDGAENAAPADMGGPVA